MIDPFAGFQETYKSSGGTRTMGLALVQLGDIHLSMNNKHNDVLGRSKAICGAIRASLSRDDACIIVVAGDIANWGNEKEYELAYDFIESIHKEVSEHVRSTPTLVMVPGNHDLDFKLDGYDEQMRDVLMGGIEPSSSPSDGILNYLLQPQQPFRDFCTLIPSSIPTYAATDLIQSYIIEYGSTKIQFQLLNSSWWSRKEEKIGSLWFPIDELEQHISEHQCDGALSVAVMHHPYPWFVPDNASRLQQVLEHNCDIVLTGHQHVAELHQVLRRSTVQNLYVEGGVLQDHAARNNSAFNIIRVDFDREVFHCTTQTWMGGVYEPSETSEYRYLRLRKPLTHKFKLSEACEEWLEDIGTDFKHPRCQDLKLNKLFVYPDLQQLDVKKACRPSGLVQDSTVVGFVQDKKHVLIAGAEKTGKTCLAKKLFSDLREAGYVMLSLRRGFSIKGGKNKSIEESITKALDDQCEWCYAHEAAKLFWQTPVPLRAIIIDDYHKLPAGTRSNDFLQWLTENFGIVILFSDPSIRMTELLNRTSDETLLWTFEHVDIMEADRKTCYGLIQNWLMAGISRFD
jgi:UDP-2,3-diacylglucosamine pyrophosphatase LpxH